MNKLLFVASLFYLFFIFTFISPALIYSTSVVYADYVPVLHFAKNTPQAFKQLFLSVARDGENTVSSIQTKGVIFHGPRNKKRIALTFDADMTPWMRKQLLSGNVKSYYNRQLIDYLDKTHTKATLFLTGMWIELYPDVAKQLAADPLFELANHSYSHPSFAGYCYDLPQMTSGGPQGQIEKTQQLLYLLTQVKNTLFRFPGGCYSQQDLTLLHKDDIQAIQWDVVGDDGFNNNTQAIEASVLNHVQNGSIVVMHMNGYPNDPKTIDALPYIIQTLKKRGYSFVTVSELLSQENIVRKNGALLLRQYLFSDDQFAQKVYNN